MSVKRFIFVSTQSVYGISNYKKKTIKENDKNIRPITQYAKSKLKAEKRGKSIKNFKIGYTPPKSKNKIPTCSKDGCYTISFEEKNNVPYCKFHFQRA